MKTVIALIFAIGCADTPELDSGFAADDKLAASATASCVGQCWATWLTDIDACYDDVNDDVNACLDDFYDDLESLKDSDSFPYTCEDQEGWSLSSCLADHCQTRSNSFCDAYDAMREQKNLCTDQAWDVLNECLDDADADRDACIADCKQEANAQVSVH